MPRFETNTRKIEQRLIRESWVREHGGSRDKFSHPERPGVLVVLVVLPRHRTVSPGVARNIARTAGWA